MAGNLRLKEVSFGFPPLAWLLGQSKPSGWVEVQPSPSLGWLMMTRQDKNLTIQDDPAGYQTLVAPNKSGQAESFQQPES